MSINIDDIKELVEISSLIGSKSEYIQGGGGNTSVKVNETTMLIKASGFCLKDMTVEDGFSIVNYQNISQKILADNQNNDEDINSFIKNQIILNKNYPSRKPSIETGFHALLQKYVIHDHSVFANILTCSKEGKGIAHELFPDSLWIKYCSPGDGLTLEIANAVKTRNYNIIFLQNHGLIINTKTKKEALALHEKTNSAIKDRLKIKNLNEELKKTRELSFLRKNVLFPDQVVFTHHTEILDSLAAKETIWAYNYILDQIINSNLTPSFLKEEEVNFIDNMESEKFRRGLVK